MLRNWIKRRLSAQKSSEWSLLYGCYVFLPHGYADAGHEEGTKEDDMKEQEDGKRVLASRLSHWEATLASGVFAFGATFVGELLDACGNASRLTVSRA